eukprot:gnl/Spiro4/9286_TR4895_c0_g1_i1.p1 gnl/Spiro4/9286_TR4895_c0_g1~~gnl/Spiro4/9286_TR4895_c0_g1_i1.p1  ORF type:complete len:189 (+),score=29.59 gnl/Spiro4/9286_TR4895_c0_g1_i1:52-567(+)
MSWRAALSLNMQEIIFNVCQTSKSSHGAREFIWNNYRELKRLNPFLPFLVRETQGTTPRVIVRYDFGQKVTRDLTDMSEAEVEWTLKEMNRVGEIMPRSRESIIDTVQIKISDYKYVCTESYHNQPDVGDQLSRRHTPEEMAEIGKINEESIDKHFPPGTVPKVSANIPFM